MNEKYVMKKSMHLGFIKVSFPAGTVIEHDKENGVMKIDGKSYDSVKDLEIMKRNAWVMPYSEDAVAQAKSEEKRPVLPESKPNIENKSTHMKIVKSDADLTEEINIKHTKIANRKEEVKKDLKVVIRADENVEERIERLRQEKKMPIVRDDRSLNMDGESYKSMNAGVIKEKSAEEYAKLKAEAEAKAKKGIDTTIEIREKIAGRGRPKGSKNVKTKAVTKENSNESNQSNMGNK